MNSKLSLWIMISALLVAGYTKINGQDAPPWEWAKAIYGTKLIESPAIAVDPSSGDVYTTGSYRGTVDLNPDEEIFNLDSIGFHADMFISKLDGNGNFVWAKQISAAPPSGSCYGYSIKVDPSGGDVYTTGAFYGSVDFDPGQGTNILINQDYPKCNGDIFISKLDRHGSLKWAIGLGGSGEDFGRSIAIDPSGNGDVYFLGSFNGTISYNSSGVPDTLTSVGEYDIFVAKLNASGNVLWAKSFGGKKYDAGFAMTVDPQHGDVYITGDFTGQVNFNPVDSSNILTSGPSFDIFILKLDRDGNFVWVKPIYGPGSKGSIGYAIAIDPHGSGDVYTTGYFRGEVDFNPDEEVVFNLNSAAGKNDIFISKLNSSGNFIWAKGMGGIGDDKGNAIAIDPNGEGGVYIMGNFTECVDFDPSPNMFQLNVNHSNNIFISKLNSSGEFEWAKPIFSKLICQSPCLTLEGQSLYTAGLFFNPRISFDSIELTNSTSSGGFWDVYIAKLNTAVITSVVEAKEHQINIYPSPATNELTIEFEGDEFQDLGITMYNIIGEVVYSNPNLNAFGKKTIDISSLATGLYFVEINVGEEKVIKKIVKE